MAVDRVGNIFDFAGSAAPDNALVCDGSEVSQTTYADLYTAIGSTWNTTNGAAAPAGGNFRLPPQANGAGGLFMRPHGGSGESVGDYIEDTNLQHNHACSTNSTGSHGHGITMNYHNNVKSSGQTAIKSGGSTFYSSYAGTHTHTLTTAADSTGKKARPDAIVMLRCIWYK